MQHATRHAVVCDLQMSCLENKTLAKKACLEEVLRDNRQSFLVIVQRREALIFQRTVEDVEEEMQRVLVEVMNLTELLHAEVNR